ncbi:hypothetical protein BDN70DRAFT_990541 [Pholiota conissans]|uniref:Uncharacterized protein n=1 Tax=Pholiota conissans TaxID=109636 RepID=A0A9P5ZB21_9AGAR|nr:hypothetical protein BDN70DRAFT_990541 [Pholiota conissans]
MRWTYYAAGQTSSALVRLASLVEVSGEELRLPSSVVSFNPLNQHLRTAYVNARAGYALPSCHHAFSHLTAAALLSPLLHPSRSWRGRRETMSELSAVATRRLFHLNTPRYYADARAGSIALAISYPRCPLATVMFTSRRRPPPSCRRRVLRAKSPRRVAISHFHLLSPPPFPPSLVTVPFYHLCCPSYHHPSVTSPSRNHL